MTPTLTTHTPGPWAIDGVRVFAPAFDEQVEITRDDGTTAMHGRGLIALPYAPDGAHDANARLIAAAPDLLAALKRAVDTIRAFHGIGLNGPAEAGMWELYQQSPEMKAINAAIAKAEGKA